MGAQEVVELVGMDKDKVLPEDIAGMATKDTTDTIVVDMDIVVEVDNKDGVHDVRERDEVHGVDEAVPKQEQEQWLELLYKSKP